MDAFGGKRKKRRSSKRKSSSKSKSPSSNLVEYIRHPFSGDFMLKSQFDALAKMGNNALMNPFDMGMGLGMGMPMGMGNLGVGVSVDPVYSDFGGIAHMPLPFGGGRKKRSKSGKKKSRKSKSKK